MEQKSLHPARYEFYSLCLLAFSLPIIEITKNIACILLLTFFLIRTAKSKINLIENQLGNIILIFIAGSIIAAIGATINGYSAGKITDIIRYSLIGWMIIYIPLNNKKIFIISSLLILSTFIGIADGLYSITKNNQSFFELRSVGHINHSSIYILFIIGFTLPLLLARKASKKKRIFILLTNLILIYALLETNSRATFLGLIAIITSLTLASFFNHKRIAYALCIIIISIAGIFTLNPPDIINKFIGQNTYYQDKLTPREKIWNTAIYAWKKEPIFGIGYGNFKITNPDNLLLWHPNENINFHNKEKFLYSDHSHNKYLNSLAEGGTVGLASLLILLLGIFYLYVKIAKKAIQNKNTTPWLIGINTLSIISIVGLFNTTLHHEHGILAMMLICLSYKYLSEKRHTI